MQSPERFSNLPAYSFTRLRALLDGQPPGADPIAMSIGEPKHPFPHWVNEVLAEHVAEFGKYPPNPGMPELLETIAKWIAWRYGAQVDPERQVMVLNGTREGLFNSALALSPELKAGQRPAVLTPNPFYQVYGVGALGSGADPVFVNATAETGFLPDYAALPVEVLNRTSVAYLCSPANPQGSVASKSYWAELLALAEKYDFYVFADECYSEIYRETPPPGAIEVAHEIGSNPERVVIFHSLSKRSNMPGLRAGFVAAGPEAMERIKRLRAYAGAPVPLPVQHVANRAWADESHVEENRAQYVEKYAIADAVLGKAPGYSSPKAGFFLWLPVENGEETTLKLWRETGVRVLPGAYLSRDTTAGNPGQGYIRVALVAEKDEMQRGLERLRDCLYG